MKKIILPIVYISLLSIILIPAANAAQQLKKDDVTNRTAFELAYFEKLTESAKTFGAVRTVIGLNLDFTAEGYLTKAQTEEQRLTFKQGQDTLLARLAKFDVREIIRYETIPFIVVYADERALEFMKKSSLVLNVREDLVGEPQLAESTVSIGVPTAVSAGFTGDGQTVAIIDTGVDSLHTFLTPRIVSEACYSEPNSEIPDVSSITNLCSGVCPGGGTECNGSGTGRECRFLTSYNSGAPCSHGTHVAGIAAGSGSSYSGVAKGRGRHRYPGVLRIYHLFPVSALP